MIQKRAPGISYRAIAAEVGVAKDTALRINRDWERSKKLHPTPRSGMLPKLSERDHRYLRRIVDKNPSAPLSEIATALPGVSTHTVSRALLKDDLRSHIARRKPYLDARKLKIRLEWSRLRRNWELQWRKKIFCDETTVVTGQSGHQKRVRRPSRVDIAFDPKYLAPAFTSSRFSVSICAGITYGAHSALFPIRQRKPAERTPSDHLGMNSDQYRSSAPV